MHGGRPFFRGAQIARDFSCCGSRGNAIAHRSGPSDSAGSAPWIHVTYLRVMTNTPVLCERLDVDAEKAAGADRSCRMHRGTGYAMGAMRITQKMIAEKAGVSTSLVSRILSGNLRHIEVADEKKKRVRRIAEQMGYAARPKGEDVGRRRIFQQYPG